MMTQTTIFPLELKQESEDGTFEGYGAIFGNVDRDGDIVERGAFKESLNKRTPALLWQHDQKQPIGRFEMIREDEKGLYVKGRIAIKGDGERVHELLKMGALNGLSIGFVAKRASRNAATGIRTIHEADLMEISLVTFPANDMARVENVKSTLQDTVIPQTPRSFEAFLREGGFSRSQAKAITAKGFKAAKFGSAAEIEIADLVLTVKSRITALGENRGSDCRECEPCQTKNRGISRCEALRNDIIDGNKSRWRARKMLEQLMNKARRETKRFARQHDLNLAKDALSAVVNIVVAVEAGGANQTANIEALYGIASFLNTIRDYNGKMAREYQRVMAKHVIAIENQQKRTQHLEDIFWQQVRAFERENCGRLSSRDFNRP